MTQLHAIGDTLERRDRLLDVVFVHGAGGHYLNSWGQRRDLQGGEQDSMLYWLLDDPELKDIGVWSLQHESDKTIFGQQGSITRKELANNLIQLLTNHAGIRSATPNATLPPLCWIAHSDGGNVVKVLLNICQQNRIGKSAQEKTADWIVSATQKVFFIDTPHHGTRLADMLSWIPGSRRAAELKIGSHELHQVTSWFFEQATNLDIEWLNFHQTAQDPIRVVGPSSSRPSETIRCVSVDRNHNLIARPSGKDQEPYAAIQADLCRFVQELKAPVMANALLLQRQQEQSEPKAPAEPCRLLVFIAPVPAHHEGAKYSDDTRYSLRCWFKKGASEEPRAATLSKLAGSGVDPNNLGFHQLAESIAGAYVDELNQAEELDEMSGASLLPVVFLPAELYTQPRLVTLLAELDAVICRRLGHLGIIGMPFFLACSSRWPVLGYQHPLNDTQRFLRDASKAVVDIIFSVQPCKLAELSWLSIGDWQASKGCQMQVDPTEKSPARIYKSLASSIMDRIVAGAGEANDHADYDAALHDRDALLLLRQRNSTGADAADQRRLRHLISLAKPLIWCEAMSPASTATTAHDELPSTHPMDSILDWEGPEFLAIFHRFRSCKLNLDDSSNPEIQDYIRSSTIFWEDHRYLPPIKRTSARLRSPFQ